MSLNTVAWFDYPAIVAGSCWSFSCPWEISARGAYNRGRIMRDSDTEELRSFDKLVRVLEDALEEAAKILGPDVALPSTSRCHPLERANQGYGHLSD
jgi:hypothetical protein